MYDDPPTRRRSRRLSPAVAGIAVTAMVLAGLIALSPSAEIATVRRLVGLGPDRFANPPSYTPGQGTFVFAATQPGGVDPVGFDPCRVIEYVINPDGGPDNWRELVETSAEHTAWATGLRFEYDGTTEDRPFDSDGPSLLGRRAPVVIGWATEEEIPELAGDVTGLGGSTSVRSPSGRAYLVSGSIALDAADFSSTALGFDEQLRQAVVDHEFGHLVGLGHSPDPGELMFAQQLGHLTYGPGDLEGLARLGSIPCA